jgi:hypothetical protein
MLGQRILSERLFPSLNARYISQLPDGFIYLHKTTGMVFIVNASAHRLLQYCDGEHSIKLIIELLSEEFEISKTELLNDVMDFVREAEKFNLITLLDQKKQA